MITRMDAIFEQTKNNPNSEKRKNGEILSEFPSIMDEFIIKNFAAFEQEYEWLSKQFNEQNIDISYAREMYEYFDETKTLSYKFKHVIVVVLRKLHVYDKIKQMIGKV